MLVLAGTTFAVDATFTDLDHVETDCDESPTCVATTRAGEDDITTTVTSRDGAGRYRAVLTAPDDLDHIDIVWEGEIASNPVRRTDSIEVVGAEVCTVADVYALPEMAARQKVDRRRVADLIGDFVDLATRWIGESPVPRRTQQTLRVGQTVLAHSEITEILGVTVDGTAVSGDIEWSGSIIDRSGWTYGDAIVDYIHGREIPELRLAAARWVASVVANDDAGRSRDMLWQTTDAGTIRYSSPDWSKGRPTGVIAVDAVLGPLGGVWVA